MVPLQATTKFASMVVKFMLSAGLHHLHLHLCLHAILTLGSAIIILKYVYEAQ